MDKAKQALEKFLEAWKDSNYTKQLKPCQITYKHDHTKKDIEKMFKGLPIKDFKVLAIDTLRDWICNISFTVTAVTAKGIVKKKGKARLVCEKAAFKPDSNGIWGVNPISTIRLEDA